LIKFLSRLVKDCARKVFLILDNLRVRHSKQVKTWLEKHKDQIELFFLPAYSPEFNPDEYLKPTRFTKQVTTPPVNRGKNESLILAQLHRNYTD